MAPQVLEPATLLEALTALGDESRSSKVIAGGTGLTLLLRQQLLSPDRLIALHRLPLTSITMQEARVSVGALATHAQIAASALVRKQYPALASAFGSVATPRIRNMATVGGNLVHADPHLDPPVALMAAGASVTASSIDSEREIPLSDLLLGYFETELAPAEILTSVHVPARSKDVGLSFIKHLSRSKDDYAAVDVSVWLSVTARGGIEDARVAIGGAGPTVFRVSEAEALLRGAELDPQIAIEAGDASASQADPDSDTRGSADYKRHLIRVLVPRAIELAMKDAARPLEGASPSGHPRS